MNKNGSKNIFIKLKNLVKPYYLPYLHRFIKRKQVQVFNANGNEVLKAAKIALDEAGVFFWLDFGTLLGAYRDGRLITHDSDIDVAIFLKDYNPKIKETLVKHGFKFNRRLDIDEGSYGLEEGYSYKNVGFDIFYYIRQEDKMYCHLFPLDSENNMLVRELYVTYSGFKTIDFLGEKFNIPKDTEQRLIDTYGEDYRIPIKDWYTPDAALNSKLISKTCRVTK